MDFDNGWKNLLKGCWSCSLLPVSGFGFLWLIAWFFKQGYQDLARTSGFGNLTPFIASAVAIAPLIFLSFVNSSLNENSEK